MHGVKSCAEDSQGKLDGQAAASQVLLSKFSGCLHCSGEALAGTLVSNMSNLKCTTCSDGYGQTYNSQLPFPHLLNGDSNGTNQLEKGPANFLCKGPESKYF